MLNPIEKNHLNKPVAFVCVQYVEDYGIGMGGTKPYYKFKGGDFIVVENSHLPTVIGLVLKHLHENGLSNSHYPTSVKWFNSVNEAVESLDEYERGFVKRIELPA